MNYFGELSAEGFLTEDEYLNSEFFYANVYQTESDLVPQISAEICQSEPKNSINLRSGPKKVSHIPKNKIVSSPKQSSSQAHDKRTDQGESDKTAEIEEVKRNVQTFNFENELCKIKILVPFTELMKNPCYINLVLKMIDSTANQYPQIL